MCDAFAALAELARVVGPLAALPMALGARLRSRSPRRTPRDLIPPARIAARAPPQEIGARSSFSDGACGSLCACVGRLFLQS